MFASIARNPDDVIAGRARLASLSVPTQRDVAWFNFHESLEIQAWA